MNFLLIFVKGTLFLPGYFGHFSFFWSKSWEEKFQMRVCVLEIEVIKFQTVDYHTVARSRKVKKYVLKNGVRYKKICSNPPPPSSSRSPNEII